jgi:hypothetical protein
VIFGRFSSRAVTHQGWALACRHILRRGCQNDRWSPRQVEKNLKNNAGQDDLEFASTQDPGAAGKADTLCETHLTRARRMTTNGYRYLLAGGAPH